MSTPEPPPFPSDSNPGGSGDLPSYGSVPPPPTGGGSTPPPPPPGGMPGWPPQGPTGPAQNQKALIAMILGIVAIPFMFCCGCIGIPAGVGALVCGILGRKEIQNSGGAQSGAGMALAGIIIGSLAIAGTVILMIAGVAVNLADIQSGNF